MSDVADEIVREILSRLSVAPLLRFRCVSKSWKDLIDSPEFVKQHLNHSCKSNSNLNIISRSSYIRSADFDLINETNMATFQVLSHPFKSGSGTEILGVYHGLLALSNGNYEDIILCNPSTRRLHRLPVSDIEFPKDHFTCCQFIVYGFGYDCVTDDYKFVRMIQFYGKGDDDFESEVKVYSLKSRSWRRIPDLPYYLKYKRINGLIANGALHWIVSRKVESDTDSLILAFHLGTEEYKLVPLPEFDADDFHMNVEVLGGCLSVMCNYFKGDRHIDIWVMKEYEVKESWSILFTVSVRQFFDVGFGSFDFFRPIAYSKCGKKVLLGLDSGSLLWYHLDNKSAESMGLIPIDMELLELYTCMQSLVMLDGGTWNSDKVTTKKQERKGKKKSSRKRNDFLSKGFNLVL